MSLRLPPAQGEAVRCRQCDAVTCHAGGNVAQLSVGCQHRAILLCVTLDDIITCGYITFMIRSFKDRETEKVFNGQFSRRLPHDIQRIAERKLIMLHRSTSLIDLRVPPANRLEALQGERAGQHSIRINDQWRVCFEWREDGVYEVEIVDYH